MRGRILPVNSPLPMDDFPANYYLPVDSYTFLKGRREIQYFSALELNL
jgi:hypothetical protein